MKPIMKYILLFILFATINSCQKFLDRKPNDFPFPDNYYETPEQLDLALNGVYEALANSSLYGNNALYLLGWSADEGFMNRTSVPTGPFANNHNPGEQYLTAFWRIAYVGINRANSLLEGIDRNLQIDESKRKVAKGEALFLRGYFYFLLVQNFGGVPLKLKPNRSVTSDIHVPRATDKEVYNQILKDMQGADSLVKDIITGEKEPAITGRVNKSAVWGMLARVCLYMAGYPLRDESKYADAVKWAEKVINSQKHDLNPSYSDIFITLAQDRYDAKESIFEVEYWGNGTDIYTKTGRNGWINGIKCANAETGRSDAYMNYTSKLVDVYDQPGDLRAYWCIPYFDYTSTGSSGSKTLVSRPISPPQQYARTPGKFRREFETRIPKMVQRTPINVQLLRYADVLLMYAEALNEIKGPVKEAVDAVNKVRERAWSTGIDTVIVTAGGSGYTEAPQVVISGNGQGATATAIVKEGVVTNVVLDRDSTGIQYYKAGNNYTAAPAITFSGGKGSGAAAHALIFKKEDAMVKPQYKASKQSFRAFIREERVRELNFENMRRADLIRWGIYYETMQDMAALMSTVIPGSSFISYYSSTEKIKHLLFPIPNAEITNNNRITQQNPGW